MLCNLCQTEMESVEHMFFLCDYSKQVWTQVLQSQGMSRNPRGWMHESRWMIRKTKGRGDAKVKLKIIFSATVYYLWQERNGRIFNAKANQRDAIVSQITIFLRLRLM